MGVRNPKQREEKSSEVTDFRVHLENVRGVQLA